MRADEKLRESEAPPAAVAAFSRQLERLRAGETGLMPESDIVPVDGLADAEALPEPHPERVRELLGLAVAVKLNGGLGTSMGLSGPKALLPVKGDQTFLDVIARQVLDLRARSGAQVPLVLMHSFATRVASLDRLASHPGLGDQPVALDFVQGRVPKLRADDLEAVEWPADPALEWAPPGHGDLYPSLVASGALDALLAAGLRYAFVSNSDNLGATLDAGLLAWFASSGAPFAMEVADRTAADRKGGHLARRVSDGGLVLREIAQTPDEDVAAFQDIERHAFFNTNNLWIDLAALRETLDAGGGVLDLPLIVNRKTVDPKDPGSTPVVQVETAMGAAIASLPGAQAIRVPRTRLIPVKTTDDLLSVRSDAYALGEDATLTLDPIRAGRAPAVSLHPAFKLVADFDARFASGPPSLRRCDRLDVIEDVSFGADVVCEGSVTVAADVPDGAVLAG